MEMEMVCIQAQHDYAEEGVEERNNPSCHRCWHFCGAPKRRVDPKPGHFGGLVGMQAASRQVEKQLSTIEGGG